MTNKETRTAPRWSKKLRHCVRKVCAAQAYEIVDGLAARARLKQHIEKVAEDGKVLVVSSSIDCDLYEVTGRKRLLPAHVVCVVQFSNRLYDDAKGPVSYFVERPSSVDSIVERHRDIAAEQMNY